MIRRNTRIMLGVFVVLVAVALVVSRTSSGEPELTPTAAPEPVWNLQSSDIVGITVEDLAGGQVIELTRDEQDLWRMVQPQEMAVDAARVERAASWLAAPRPRAEILDPGDLSAFELDSPQYRIGVQTADGDQLQLTIGREAPTGGSRYALVGAQLGVKVFSSAGLDEVLQLGPDLLPTATPEPSATPTGTSAPESSAPTGQTATALPTPSTPQATQESGG